MQKDNGFESSPLSLIRLILLQVLYWLFFIFVLPRILSKTLFPSGFFSTNEFLILQWANYFICMLVALILSFPLLKKEWKLDISKMAYTIIVCIALMFLMNLGFSLLMEFINGPTISNNQNALNRMLPFANRTLYFTMSVILAPVLEELIFRGGIFRTLRSKRGFLFSALLSSLMFGFIHVQSSIFIGDFRDVIYLFLYGLLGVMLAYSYEYNHSILACIIIHSLYNFIITATLF